VINGNSVRNNTGNAGVLIYGYTGTNVPSGVTISGNQIDHNSATGSTDSCGICLVQATAGGTPGDNVTITGNTIRDSVNGAQKYGVRISSTIAPSAFTLSGNNLYGNGTGSFVTQVPLYSYSQRAAIVGNQGDASVAGLISNGIRFGVPTPPANLIDLYDGQYLIGIRDWTWYGKSAQRFRWETAHAQNPADPTLTIFEIGDNSTPIANTYLYVTNAGATHVTDLTVSGTCTGCGGGVTLDTDQTITGQKTFTADPIIKKDTAATAYIDVYSASGFPMLTQRRARGTGASPVTVQSGTPGDVLGRFAFSGYASGNFQVAAAINTFVDGVSGANVAGRLEFWAQNTSGSQGDATLIVSAGGISVSKMDLSSHLTIATEATPANPASGNLRLYANSTTAKLACLTSAGADCMPSGGSTSPPISWDYTSNNGTPTLSVSFDHGAAAYAGMTVYSHNSDASGTSSALFVSTDSTVAYGIRSMSSTLGTGVWGEGWTGVYGSVRSGSANGIAGYFNANNISGAKAIWAVGQVEIDNGDLYVGSQTYGRLIAVGNGGSFAARSLTGVTEATLVRNSDGTGSCTLVFTGGIKTGGTCASQ
jgi:hypothetical protein